MRTLLFLALAATAALSSASVSFLNTTACILNSSDWPSGQPLSASASVVSSTSAILSIGGYLGAASQINHGMYQAGQSFEGLAAASATYVAKWNKSSPTDVAPDNITVHFKVYHRLEEIINNELAQGGGSIINLHSHAFISPNSTFATGSDLSDLFYRGSDFFGQESNLGSDSSYVLVSEGDIVVSRTGSDTYSLGVVSDTIEADVHEDYETVTDDEEADGFAYGQADERVEMTIVP